MRYGHPIFFFSLLARQLSEVHFSLSLLSLGLRESFVFDQERDMNTNKHMTDLCSSSGVDMAWTGQVSFIDIYIESTCHPKESRCEREQGDDDLPKHCLTAKTTRLDCLVSHDTGKALFIADISYTGILVLVLLFPYMTRQLKTHTATVLVLCIEEHG